MKSGSQIDEIIGNFESFRCLWIQSHSSKVQNENLDFTVLILYLYNYPASLKTADFETN